MKSSQEWQAGAVSLPPLQRGTTWCPRVGTWRLQNTQASFIHPIRYAAGSLAIRLPFGINSVVSQHLCPKKWPEKHWRAEGFPPPALFASWQTEPENHLLECRDRAVLSRMRLSFGP